MTEADPGDLDTLDFGVVGLIEIENESTLDATIDYVFTRRTHSRSSS
jgi:hypothetical protein